MKKRFYLLIIFLLASQIISQEIPKREFRASWIATVANLDWPSTSGQSTETKKTELITMLDELQAAGINAVVFQVRPECDALYESNYEPWSYYLTGSQGTPPSPYFDPLAFAIEESHKRGIELHAWFNPYRAVRSVGQYNIHDTHVSKENPEWILQIGNFKFLNPGIPDVREYVTAVIMDVVDRYDVDGVHFDDYFYPYPPDVITNQDNATFNQYPNGFSNIGDWRRDNINRLIEMVNTSINASKPWIKFGISPFGIWRPQNPPGISGMDAYASIYADAKAWLNAETLDYLTPQLYWPIGGSQDYRKLVGWWADQLNGRHLYPGHGLYRAGTWGSDEVPAQLRINRSEPNVNGSVYFRAGNLLANTASFTDSLKQYFYKNPALKPIMDWKETVPPNPIQNLTFKQIEGKGVAGLVWDEPEEASDGDIAFQYAVYNMSQFDQANTDDGSQLTALPVNEYYIPKRFDGTTKDKFLVSALDRLHNESPTESIVIGVPVAPQLAQPENDAQGLSDSVIFVWDYAVNASFYDIEVSQSEDFSEVDFKFDNIGDTSFAFQGFAGLSKYFWRVKSANAIGESGYSDTYSFTTGFPAAPSIVAPEDVTVDHPINLTFVWNSTEAATEYRLQVSKSLSFFDNANIIDTIGLTDTTFYVEGLDLNKIYFWRVSADNSIGWSGWSDIFRFKTVQTVGIDNEIIPAKFALEQNYPNPFNPSTSIDFSIPENGFATLKIYDILGREVVTLLEENLQSGNHTINFDARRLNSGVFIYVLQFNGKVLTNKMTFLK